MELFKINPKKNFILGNLTGIKFFVFLVIFFSILFGLFSSCNKNLSQDELIHKIKKIYYQDQEYRRILGMLEQNNTNHDSKTTSQKHNSVSWHEKTSLVNDILFDDVINSLDRKNTEKLIAITKKYGFPGMKHLQHDIPVFLVFVHSDKKYFKEIRKLITKGYKAGQVSKFERDFIFWHLNGRKEMPPRIPHPINYRTDVAIFRGALNDEKLKH